MNFAREAKFKLIKMTERAEAMERDASEANKRALAYVAKVFEKAEA